MEHTWPTLGEVLAVHRALSENPEGAVRDMAALEAALFRAQAGAYGTVTAAAAALFEGMSMNRPFKQANRASAFATMDVFLRLNGWRLVVDADDALRAALDVKDIEWPIVGSWLLKNARPS